MMMQSILHRKTKTSPLFNSIFYPLMLFSISWLLTALVSIYLWGSDLPRGSWPQLLAGFLLPFTIVLVTSIRAIKTTVKFRIIQWLFIAILGLVTAVVLFFPHLSTRIYGDYGQLSTDVSHNVVFPRWLIGSSLLKLIYEAVVLPLRLPISDVAYIRLFGAIIMCLFSFFLVKKYPDRLAVVLPLLTPVWLLFCSGYNEYYPFIAPVFIFVLLFLTEKTYERISPLLMGFLAAFILLLYAGYVPIAIFLLGVYWVKRGLRNGIVAALSAIVFSLLMIFAFSPSTIGEFFKAYLWSLNLTESYLYPGLEMARTPFFKVSYALSAENWSRMFYQFFWAGGLASVLLIPGLIFRKPIRSRLFKNFPFITILLMFLFQFFYFVFMIPRLGPYFDIDLFFTVYLTFAFLAGFLADKFSQSLDAEKRAKFQLSVFALMLGNSAFLVMNLLFIGLPQ